MKNASFAIVLLLAGSSFAVVPTKYFEYVQSTKDLYVDIDYTPKCDTVIETRVSIDNDSGNNTIFCSRGSTSTYYTLFHIGGSTLNFRWDYYNSTKLNSGRFDPDADVAIDLRTTPEGLYVYGQLAEKTTPQQFTPNQKMILFASYGASTTRYAGDGNWSRMKMYSFRIFDKNDDGQLVLAYDYVPAEVDGVVGLYDRVTGAFHGSAVANQLVPGPEVSPVTGIVSLREDVLNRGYAFTPGGTPSKSQSGFGPTNLFDGVKLVRSTNSYATSARWIGDEQSEQYVEIDPEYFAERSGMLLSYTLHKISMNSYAVNARTPTSWRIEGVLATDAVDNWMLVDEQTDVVWPGLPDGYSYVYNGNENPPTDDADLSLTFSVPDAKRMPYRKLRFVPTNSKMYEHGGDNFYSLMELDFTVADAVSGMDADILQVSAVPQLCGDAQRYRTTLGHVAGETVELAMGEMEFANADETLRGVCTGWKLYTYDDRSRNWVYDETDPASHGDTTNCTFTFPSVAAKVEWQFRMQAKVELAADGVGTVNGADWYDLGSTVTVSTTDSADSAFRHWTGLPADVSPTEGEVSFVVTGPVSATAKFSGFRWVAKTGSDDNDGSEAAPFLTLNKAVEDLGTAGGTIYIAPGTYKEIYDSSLLTAVTVTNEVSIIGTGAKPEDVILSSQQTDKTRHVIKLDNAWALLKNVWIKDGNQTSENWGNDDMGVNVRIGANGGTVEDCRLSMSIGGNWAQKGQCLWMDAGRVSRCRFIKNSNNNGNTNIRGTALGASSGIIEDCLFVSNTCKQAATVYLTGTATMINCTIADNTGPNYSGVHIDSDTATAVNCIIYGNTADATVGGGVYKGKPERFFNCYSDIEIPGGVSCTVGAFPFVEPGDYHLNIGSACIDTGVDRAGYAATSVTDLDGAVRNVAPQVDLGCYESQKNELTCGFDWSAESYFSPADVTLTANVVGASGDVACDWTLHNAQTGEDVTVSGLTPSATGLAAGLYTVTLTAVAGGATASYTVESAFRVGPKEIFAVTGNAAAAFPYDSREKGTSDLAETLEAAIDGSIIHVAPGEYSVTNQLILKKAVSIVADESDPRRTLIGRVDGTTRIIQLNNPSALVAGFTLHDGMVSGAGGIAYINAYGGTISNCVMRGGRTLTDDGSTAGAIQMLAGLVVHCTIDDCIAVTVSDTKENARVVVMSGGRMSNCLIKNCKSTQAGQIVSIGSSCVLENCTIVDCVLPAGSKSATISSGTARNCAIFVTDPDGNPLAFSGTDSWSNFWPTHFVNCVTAREICEYTTGNGGKGWYYGKDCVTNATEVECFRAPAAADYRVKKLGPLVDAGTNGVGLMLETDLGGHPRVRNEIIDVGCYEDFPTAFGLFLR